MDFLTISTVYEYLLYFDLYNYSMTDSCEMSQFTMLFFFSEFLVSKNLSDKMAVKYKDIIGFFGENSVFYQSCLTMWSKYSFGK